MTSAREVFSYESHDRKSRVRVLVDGAIYPRLLEALEWYCTHQRGLLATPQRDAALAMALHDAGMENGREGH